MEVSMKRPVPVVTSVLRCRSFTESERQHLFRVSRLFITSYYAFVCYYGLFVLDLRGIDIPTFLNLGDNWWWKCISVWNLAIQTAYFIYCTVFIDFADSGPGKTWIKPRLQKNKKIRDFVYFSIIFPITIDVCVMFWVICVVNKPLLFPNEMKNWVPDWYNHAVHTNPIVLTLFEMVTTDHRLPKMIESTAGLFALSGSYVACLLYNKFTTGRWVYLIIGEIVSSLPELVLYFAVTAFIMPFMCMLIGYKLYSFSSLKTKKNHKLS
ncbi:FAR-17a/AIG1-like protein [Cinara cedri]|uniref:FAR-17a/AIG1-like protein n=1 Tax=Cinara cedri TaxID=506608 RepID=A0A5E4NPK7_9HEMI|nr:FAR-17a/AIG1-like protein [Cinara cedri]